MSGAVRFEDLVAWQRARELTKTIYFASRKRPLCSDFSLARQMQRAAVSVMANIAEGFERKRSGEFHQFLSTAKSSCGELRSHIYVALDTGALQQAEATRLLDETRRVGEIINALRVAVGERRGLNSERRTQNAEPLHAERS